MTALLVIGGLGVGAGSIGWAVFTEAPATVGWGGAFAGLLLYVAGGAIAPEIEEKAAQAENRAEDRAEDGDGWWAGRKDEGNGTGCGAVTGGDGCGGCGCGG